MTGSSLFVSKRLVVWFSLFLACFYANSAGAEEIKLEIQLVWGTNDEKSSSPDHKALDPAIAKKLKMFKWKNYFVVSRQEVVVPNRASKKIKLSSKCYIEVKELEGPRIEVNVYGEDRHVKKITEGLAKQGMLTIAGDDKNDCAWFIIIRQLP